MRYFYYGEENKDEVGNHVPETSKTEKTENTTNKVYMGEDVIWEDDTIYEIDRFCQMKSGKREK